MSSDKTLGLEDDFIERWKTLNENWSDTFKYYQESDKYIVDLRTNMYQAANTIDLLNSYAINEKSVISNKAAQLKDTANKDFQSTQTSAKEINDLSEKLVQSVKLVDGLKSSMKKSLFTLSVKGVTSLNVNETPAIKELFNFLVTLTYKDKTQFEWSKFSKDFSADKGEKFIVSLAAVNFSLLNDQNVTDLNKYKSHQSLAALKTKGNETISTLLNYLDLLSQGVDTTRVIDDLERRLKKLKVDSEFSQVRAGPISEKADKIASDISFVDDVQKKFAPITTEIREALVNLNQQVVDYKNQRTGINNVVLAKYNEIQGVPAKVYL